LKRRRRLYLVGQDPADIFEDLDKLKSDLANPKQARERAKETFARIPHDKALALFKLNLSGSAWAVLFELDRVILRRRGQNPVRFDCPRLAAAGLSGHTRSRALRQLEAAGVVKVTGRGPGLSPWVTHLWFPLRD
jgi:hypothetical protein